MRNATLPTGPSDYLAVVAAEFIALMGFAASGPVLPSFIRELGVTDQAALKVWSGLATALPSLALALASPLWGALADRFGRKPMLLRALFGGFVLTGLISLSPGPWLLIVLRTIQGGLTGTVAAATVLVASTSPEELMGRRLGILQAAVFAGNSLGPYVGGRIAELLGNRASFVFTSLLLLAGGMIVLLGAREEWRGPDRSAPGAGAQASFKAIAAPSLLPLLAVVFMYQFAGSNVSPILPLYIEDLIPDPSMARSISGLVMGAAGLSSALAAAFSGRIGDRFGHARVLSLALGTAGLLTVLQGWAGGIGSLMALRAAAGFCLGGTMPSVNALIALRSPRASRGAVFGASTSIGQAGTALGPVVGAAISIFAGYRILFAVTGAFLGLTSAGMALAWRRGREAKV